MRIKSLFLNKSVAKSALPILLRFHNWLYKLITRLSIIHNRNIHPKHHIVRYEDWFIDQLKADDIVLEIGSHTGDMSRKIAPFCKEVHAVEKDRTLFLRALETNKLNNINFVNIDATELNLTNEIDVVILSNVLEHINDRTAFLKKLKQRIRWKASPKILIRVPLITRDWLACYKKELNVPYFLDPTHFIEYTEEELQEELTSANLKIQSFTVRFGEAYVICN